MSIEPRTPEESPLSQVPMSDLGLVGRKAGYEEDNNTGTYALKTRLALGGPESLRGKALTAVAAEPEFARAFALRVGVPPAPKQAFCSIIPNRGHLRAQIAWRKDCWQYEEEDGRRYSLAAAFASFVGRQRVYPRSPELVRWTIRLLAEGGLLDLPPLAVEPLRDSHPASVSRVLKAIALLARVRLASGDLGPFPLSRNFLGRWAGGIGDTTAESAKIALRQLGYLRVVRTGPPIRFGHETNFWDINPVFCEPGGRGR